MPDLLIDNKLTHSDLCSVSLVTAGLERKVRTPAVATIPLLDTYGSASAAFSLRKLKTGVTDVVEATAEWGGKAAGFTPTEIGNGTLANYCSGLDQTTLPGDTATLHSGYSLRLVRAAYSGGLFLARRGGDDVEETFYQGATAGTFNTTSGGGGTDLDTWAVAGSGDGNAYIKTWHNQGVTGNDITQATTTKQPKLRDSSTGIYTDAEGNPEVLFDGTDDYIQTASGFTLTTTDTTWLTVSTLDASIVDNNISAILVDGDNATNRQLPGFKSNSGTPDSWAMYSGLTTVYGGDSDSNQRLCFTHFDPSGSSTQWKQGVSEATGSTGSEGVDGITLGSRYDGAAVFWKGHIQEVLLFASDQTANQQALEDNVRGYYMPTVNADGVVSKWYDQSGNTRDAVQATYADAPVIVQDGVLVTENGEPALEFVTSDFLDAGDVLNLPTGQAFSIFLLCNFGSGSQVILAKGQNNYNVSGWYIDRGHLFGCVSGSSTVNSTGALLNTQVLQDWVHDGSLVDAFQNGSAGDTDEAYTSTANTEDFRIGVYTTAPNAADFEGRLQEVVIYESNQEANRTAIEADINTHYTIY